MTDLTPELKEKLRKGAEARTWVAMALFDPRHVLALLDEVVELEAEVARLQAERLASRGGHESPDGEPCYCGNATQCQQLECVCVCHL